MHTTFGALRARFTSGGSLPMSWEPCRDSVLLLLDMLAGGTGTSPDNEVFLGFVPGRIEVFGRHTDYAGGRSIVCSIDRGFLFAAAPGSGRRIRIREDSAEFRPVEFDLDPDLAPPAGEWAN